MKIKSLLLLPLVSLSLIQLLNFTQWYLDRVLNFLLTSKTLPEQLTSF